MLFNIFSKSSDAWLSGQRSMERFTSGRQAMDFLERDLSHAFYFTNIDFFGFSNAIYCATVVPHQIGAISDIAQAAYVVDTNTGNLYRYYTPPTTNSWSWWGWPTVTNSVNYTYQPPQDALLAQGVVSLQFSYNGYSNSTWWILSSWDANACSNLPTQIDIKLTVLPRKLWQPSASTGYDTLTNRYARTFQTSVYIQTSQ